MLKSLTPLLAATGVGLIVLLVAHWSMRNRRQTGSSVILEGFSGWLLFIACMQWISVLGVGADVLRQFSRYQGLLSVPEKRTAAIIEVVAHVGLLAFVLYAAVIMIQRRQSFPALLRTELLLLVLWPVLDLFFVTSATGPYVTAPKAIMVFALRFVVSAIVAGIVFAYLRRSERVRTTFVR